MELIPIFILRRVTFDDMDIYYYEKIFVSPKELVELIDKCETIKI